MLEIFKVFGCIIASIVLIYLQRFVSFLAEPEYSCDGYNDEGEQLEIKFVSSIWLRLLNLFLCIFSILPLLAISCLILEIDFTTSVIMSIIATILFMFVTGSISGINFTFHGLMWEIKSLFNKEANISMVIKKNAKSIPEVDLRNEKNLKINKDFRKKYFYTVGFCLPKDFIIEQNVFENYGHYLVIICDKSRVNEFKKMDIRARVVPHEEFDKTGWTLQQYVKRIKIENDEMEKALLDCKDKGITEFIYLSRWMNPIDCSTVWIMPEKLEIYSQQKELPGFIAEYYGSSSKRKIKNLEFCSGIIKIKEIHFTNYEIDHLTFAKSIKDIEDFKISGETTIKRIFCSEELREKLISIVNKETKFTII